jgi:hypothetical protein
MRRLRQDHSRLVRALLFHFHFACKDHRLGFVAGFGQTSLHKKHVQSLALSFGIHGKCG